MGNINNIKIEPMNVTWGEDVAQVQKISTVPDVAGSLGGKYFFLFSALNAVKNYVWFDTGASVDPAPAGFVGLHVTISSGDTAADVALAAKLVIDASASYVATVSGNEITVTNAAVGYAAQAYDGPTGDETSFSMGLVTQGDQAQDAGYIDGDIEVSVDPNFVDIKAHQTGEALLGKLFSVANSKIKVTFKETSAANLKKIFTQLGGSFFPISASTKEVIGQGTSKTGVNTFGLAKKLVLHPVSLGASDKTRDYTFWKAFTNLKDLKFSGKELMSLPVEFEVYIDDTKPAQISQFAYGDVTGV